MRVAHLVVALFSVAISGCSLASTDPQVQVPSVGIKIKGGVHGGQQPVVGAHVYLLAANTTGYGSASVSLLNPATTGSSDSIGAYVLTDASGGFSLTGDYTCTPGTQVYLYALGGNPGAGVNLAAGFLAALGNCPVAGNLDALPFVFVNEVSTVAAAYAFAGFATDALHVSSSGSASAQIGIANAFSNAANLANLSTGAALTVTPSGNAAVPQAEINTLADLLAGCVNSTGGQSPGCTQLFANATSDSTPLGVVPNDTATAMINIAHHPASNVTALAALFALVAPSAPFLPTLTTQPNDLSIALLFSPLYSTLPNKTLITGPIAADGFGNIWVANKDNSVVKLSSMGVVLSGSTGFAPGSLNRPSSIAVDASENVWITNFDGNNVTKLSNSGSLLSGTGGFTGGGLDHPSMIAFDVSGNAWIIGGITSDSSSLYTNANLVELSNSGTAISPNPGPLDFYGGYSGGGVVAANGIAVDGSNNLWISNAYLSTDLVGNVVKFPLGTFAASPSGVIQTQGSAYSGGGLNEASSIAIDGQGDAWLTNYYSSVTEFSSSGSILSGAAGYTASGAIYGPHAIEADGSNNIWIANYSSFIELTSGGTSLSGTGYSNLLGYPNYFVLDGSGNLWATSVYGITELVGIAAPVVTPLAAAVQKNNIGSRP